MPRVSVLVAIYNAEDYLADCLDSLAGQTLSDIEVMCVDDCSTDSSYRILRDYESRDGRFRVFRTPHNSGQAVARNLALDHCAGDYITFVDADDWLSPDALERIVKPMDENVDVDCALFDLMLAYNAGRNGKNNGASGLRLERYGMKPFAEMAGREAALRSIAWQGIHGCFAMRAGLFRRYPYDTTCRVYSDDISSTLQFLYCRKVVCTEAKYYYRQHGDSSTHKPSVNRFYIMKAKERLLFLLREESPAVPREFLAEAATQVWLWLIDSCLYFLRNQNKLSMADRAYARKELKRVWREADRELIKPDLLSKPGYRPMQSWRMFWLQCRLYNAFRLVFRRS